MSELVYDRTMSDAEGLMWRLEHDPHLSSTFANVTILDRPPDFDRLRRRMERTARRIRRLRQRVQPSGSGLAPPTWVDDPDFDIDLHVRRIALPVPGSERQLLDLASLITADPFDRTRPLWQFTVVEGLEHGRAALIEKLHHSLSDGERGVQLAFEFLDLEREPPESPGHEDDEPAFSDLSADHHTDAVPTPDPDLGAADAVRDLLVGGLRLPLGVIAQVRELLAEPARLPHASARAAGTMRGIVTELGATDRARSPLWTQRSLRRRLDIVSAPLLETRDVAHRLGGTLNTAFLTIASAAAGDYHVRLGQPVESLRASMAISTRTAASGANAFTLARMLVPTGEMGIDERFAAVHEAVQATTNRDAVTSLDTIATLSTTVPTTILTRLARQQSRTVDFATSNVRGSSVAVYVAGARLVHNYPVGPLGGVAFNVTLLSYLGHLDMGVNADTAAITEPEVLHRSLDSAIADFIAV